MVAVVASAVFFLLSPATGAAYLGELRRPETRLGMLCAQGFFISPASFGWFSAASFCLSYAAYLAYHRYRYLVYSLVSAAFVLLSFRRKSILAVLAVLFVSLLIGDARRSRLRAITICAVALALVLTAAAPYMSGLWSNTVTEYGSTDPYATARSALYYTSFVIAKDHFPLGMGLASFGSYSSRLFYSSTYDEYGLSSMYGMSSRNSSYLTDTYWPMVLGEGGVISLLSYAAFFAILLVQTWKVSRRERDALTTFLAGGSLFLILGSLIESTASHFYGSSLHAILVLLPVGMFWRCCVTPRREDDGAPA
jgi:O-antigen ligase